VRASTKLQNIPDNDGDDDNNNSNIEEEAQTDRSGPK
jgi:hypothetical protein